MKDLIHDAAPGNLPLPGSFNRDALHAPVSEKRSSDSAPSGDRQTNPASPASSLHTGERTDADTRLKISVVVPTCGRADLLNRCLASLVSQDLEPLHYEIIIVDDAPSAATRDIVDAWTLRMQSRGLSVAYIANHGPHGPAAARNRGWQAARSDIIAFTDDDTVPTARWLKNGLEAFGPGRNAADAIWGSIEMPLSNTPTDYERDAKHLETAEFVTANCLCRKDMLETIAGFDERFRYAWREDSDFYFRLLDADARIVHVPDAVVIHPVRPAPWGVSISQQKKIQFDALLYKKHPRRYREKIRATPRWDYYLIVLSLAICLLSGIAGMGMAALASGAVWLLMTGWLFAKRMQGTTKTASHIAEMLLTSILIPPLAVYWRMVGAFRFRVAFL